MDNIRKRRAIVIIVALAATFGYSTHGSSAVVADGMLGGAPNAAGSATLCPSGTAVTGISGLGGTIGPNPIVASATAQCADGAAAIGAMGTGNTPATSTSCPSGQVVVGVVGREGDFIDQLAVRCRAADLSGSITTAPTIGGASGAVDGPYECPAGMRVRGFTGSLEFAGTTLRHLQIVCIEPTTITMTVAKSRRALSVTGTVAPDKDGQEVVVTLKRKRSTTTRILTLDSNSAFATSFRRPSTGRCTIAARFAGDHDTDASTATTTFRC